MSSLCNDLQETIGYRFQDVKLLQRALTHRSASREHNERLEFLGDSVLSLIVSVSLFRKFPDADEGALTRCRARLVRQETLIEIARKIELGRLVVLGEGAARSGGADRGSILADAVEALIGAVYLESGIDFVTTVIENLLQQELESIDPSSLEKDPKTELQEQLQRKGFSLPRYEIQKTRGEPHQREFVVECILENPTARYSGKGSSRQKAEQAAAESALVNLSAK